MTDAVIGVAVEYTIKPILHQLGYLFRYNKNIKEVENKLQNLATVKDTVLTLVSQEKGKGNAIIDSVTNWLDNVNEVFNEGPSNNPSCFNCVQRHQLSRKAKKRIQGIVELINKGYQFNKDRVGYPIPSPVTTSSTLPTGYQILESRTLLVERIKDALVDSNVNRIGVCGMGGVGKSTLLNEVKKLVLENNLFDLVIKIEVGQSKSVNKIQEEIGDMLNMNLNMHTDEVRASFLQTHIVETKKRILFMLDDLWKKYDVEKEFGIPCGSESRIEGCKILMASRSQHTLKNQMNTEKLIEVDCLPDEESWRFFVEIVGDQFVEDDGNIQQVAKDVVKECGRLPIALRFVAEALKGRKIEEWKDALKKLKNPDVLKVHGVSDSLDRCLRFSYDLIDEEAKLVLLLCSVFPDDHMIHVRDLQMYVMGMGILKHINSWEDARNRVITLVGDLKSSYLLLKSEDLGDDCVQMHDVVHDFAKRITSNEGKMSSLTYRSGQREWQDDVRNGLSCNAIYVDCSKFHNLPPKLFPTLQLFILRHRGLRLIQIPDTFFEGMEKLQVVDMSHADFSSSNRISSLKNLQTLCLLNCKCDYIDTIGELSKLKILVISGCAIEELPKCMSELRQLKVLSVYQYNLKVIHPNIISKMTELEEFCLFNFKGWGETISYKNKEITNAKLSELNGLQCLVILKLEIRNVEMLLLQELSSERVRNLQEFSIGSRKKSYKKTLKLNIESPLHSIGGVLQTLLEKCEHLELEDSVGFTKLLCNPQGSYDGCPDLKQLEINTDHEEMACGINGENFDLQVSFPRLVCFHITNGNIINTLWPRNNNNGVIIATSSCCELQDISIECCNKLIYVFPSCMVRLLVFLKRLKVIRCKLVERIFEIDDRQWMAGDVNQVDQAIPLTMLSLYSLPKLKHVWNYDPTPQLLTFPNLKGVNVHKCPQLQTLFPASFINHMKEMEELIFEGENEIFGETDNEASHLVSSWIVLFPRLKRLILHCKLMKKGRFWLKAEYFSELKFLRLIGSEDEGMFSLPLETSEFVRTSVQTLEIEDDIGLVQVFQNSSRNINDYDAVSTTRAKLRELRLYNLPKLMQVWEDDNISRDHQITTSTSFDSLKSIRIRRCHNLKYFLQSSSTFFNLEFITIHDIGSGMMNLFHSSVAKKLVNLHRMVICYCKEMRYIIAAPNEKGEEEEKGEEVAFNRLHRLKLKNLPKLASFHARKCIIKFPCLKQLYISRCPDMKAFSYGIISTPKLSQMELEGDVISVSQAHGVNSIIEDRWNDEIMRSFKNLFTPTSEVEEDNEEDSEEYSDNAIYTSSD